MLGYTNVQWWDNLPFEILTRIMQILIISSSSQQKNSSKKKAASMKFNKQYPQWIKVNRHWYDCYQSIKYKDITLRLDHKDKVLQNIIHSQFLPGLWVRSIAFVDLVIVPNFSYHPHFNPLYLLMTRTPNVKHVSLPQDMDSQLNSDWTYFTEALESTNTWKLQTLSVSINKLSRPIEFKQARKNYFHCLGHLRSSITEFVLTTDMLTGRGYFQLQGFQQLKILTIREGVVNGIADTCQVMNYLPRVNKMTVYFSSYNNNSTSSVANNNKQQELLSLTTTSAQSTVTAATYSKIDSLRLYEYNIFSLNQRDDLLYIKKFINLNYLYVSLSSSCIGTADVLDPTVLEYIHRVIPSYEITVYAGLDDDERVLMDLYCNGPKNNDPKNKFRLHLVFDDADDEDDNNANYSKISFIKKKNDQKSSTDTVDGYLYCYIGAGGDWNRKIAKAQKLLCYQNDHFTEILIERFCGPKDDADFRSCLAYIKNYTRCHQVLMVMGDCSNNLTLLTTSRFPDISIIHYNITRLVFEKCWLNEDVFPAISPYYPYLKQMILDNCVYGFDDDDLPYTATLELPNTAIDTLSLKENNSYHVERGLVHDRTGADTNVFISVASLDQGFSKGYICTNVSNRSMVGEIALETVDVLKAVMHDELVSYIKIIVKSIKKLTLTIDNSCTGHSYKSYFDISITFPPQ